MIDIVIATGNRHKVRELKSLLAVDGIRWHSLAECHDAPIVKEDGHTFEENAIKKAKVVAKATGWLAIADDSGIEVDALDDAPGVRSARFSGRHGDDKANNAKLLRRLEGVPRSRRGAQYRCILALASPSKVLAITRGCWRGRIAHRAVGRHGFGYDPIFLVPSLGKTVGQLSTSLKHRLSHRAKAAGQMRRRLKHFVTHLSPA